MQRFGLGVNRSHRLRELQIDIVTDCYRPEIRILAIEAALRRLIGVLEPVIADNRAPAQGGHDVAPEARRPLGLRRHQRAGAVGIGQAGVNGAKGELADQAGLAGGGIAIDRGARIEVVAIERDVYERSPVRGINYDAFIDPSGGSADSFTLAVGHTDRADWQKPVVVVDAVREQRPPFSPTTVAEEFARVLKNYNVNKIVGDKYAGAWPVEVFSKLSIKYEQSAAPKSDLYRDLLPLINSGRIRLLDNAKLINQLCGLERRVARGGRDSIDHGPGSHDDIANSVAGLASITNKYPGYLGEQTLV